MQQLDPKAIWLFFIRFLFVWVWIGIILAFVLASFWAENETDIDPQIFSGQTTLLGLIVVGISIAGSFIWAKLSWRFYRYELREDGFRKELGVIWKKYTTIPYERIQNVDIQRGLVARLLGLSDLQIQTAGSSAVYSRYGGRGLGAEGVLPGVSREKAEELRDELIRRARGSRMGSNQGL
jgi:uncharacterized membrane protein YdbT with pleckstrin-like domain